MQTRAQKTRSWGHWIGTQIEHNSLLIVGVFWEAVFQRNDATFVKNWLPKGTQIGAQAGLMRKTNCSFSPEEDKVAQVVPNGAQSPSKNAQRLPKWRQNAVQVVFHCIFHPNCPIMLFGVASLANVPRKCPKTTKRIAVKSKLLMI